MTGFLLGTGLVAQANESANSQSTTNDHSFTLGGLPVYMEVFGGLTLYPNLDYAGTDYKMDNGYNLGGSFGASLNQNVDLEFEIFYTKTSYTGFSDEFTSLSLMTNAYYNYPITEKLVGYVGAGVGAMQIAYDSSTVAYSQHWVFAYQLMAGIRYPIYQNIDIFTEYRFSDAANDATLYSTDNVEYKSHNFTVGLRYNF